MLNFIQITGCTLCYVLVFHQAERRLIRLCDEGTADISQFRELLEQGVDINSYDEVGIIFICMICYASLPPSDMPENPLK